MKNKPIPTLQLRFFLTLLLFAPVILNAQTTYYSYNTGQNGVVATQASTVAPILNKDLDTIKAGTELVAPYINTAALICYPNPASTTIFIQLPRGLSAKTKIDIYNLLGQFMYEQSQNANGLVAIDVSQWQQGAYIVRVINGSTMFTGKIIVNRH